MKNIFQKKLYENGYLIIKVNDKKIMKQINNFDKELKEIINF